MARSLPKALTITDAAAERVKALMSKATDDMVGLRIGGVREHPGVARDGDRAPVDRVHARQGLDEGRLAGAVLAHERVDLAGEHAEVDPVERGVRAEAHGGAGDLHQRQRVVHGAHHAAGDAASPPATGRV